MAQKDFQSTQQFFSTFLAIAEFEKFVLGGKVYLSLSLRYKQQFYNSYYRITCAR